MEVFVGIDVAWAIGPGSAGRAVKRRAAWSFPGLAAIAGRRVGRDGLPGDADAAAEHAEDDVQGNTMLTGSES